MDWKEINCIIKALELLVEKYNQNLAVENLDENSKSDISNDLAYTEILLSSYQQKRENLKRSY